MDEKIAREFVAAVREMRNRQKAYFKDRKLSDLNASKKAEGQVDRLLDDIGDGQGRLF